MTRQAHGIDTAELELPAHNVAEKLGTALVLLLIAVLGLLLLGYEPIACFAFGAIVFAVVVAIGLRWAERNGRN